ncbi:MAG: alpha-glucan family phosphorylase, partial [Gammaproteobacteria bacterium]|nr:alpha-glucan family phosphorylase [Gammaproteobacteria bacterium]
MIGTHYTLEIRPRIPPELGRLEELAGDLYFSWDRFSRGLFYYLDPELWEACRHNPKVFLRRVSEKRLNEAASDRAFLEEYHRTLAYFDTYHREGRRLKEKHGLESELIAYFCAEFGLHESLPIYSGGLGILAGDYCKAASDMALPFVAVGLLYREGSLAQSIDDNGQQVTHVLGVHTDDLPIAPASGPDNEEVIVSVDLPESKVLIRAWHARAGHTNLYLLDTDLEQNRTIDRGITHQLYPADRDARIRQEIVLGIGGVRVLRRLGLHPTIWHINEGHPSLLLLERCREFVQGGMEFRAAMEVAAAGTVFTTHTPVTAGHEVFDHG